MLRRSLTFMLPLALAYQVAYAQEGKLDRRYYPEELHQDLQTLRQTLEASHPDPYRYHTKAEMDLLFQSVDTGLVKPLTAEGFIHAILPLLKAVGDANTNLAPPADISSAYDHTEPLIPIIPGVLDGKLYLDRELKGFRSMPSGSRLLRINGRSAEKVLSMMRSFLVPEGGDTTRLDRRIEDEFPVLYRRAIERASSFEVDYTTPDGSMRTCSLTAMTKDQMRQSGARRSFALQDWRMEELLNINTAWLTLGSFDHKKLDAEGIAPEKFLNSVQGALRKDGLSTLVIDLRGSGGEDLDLADQVFSLIARSPFRCVRNISVRSSKVPDPSQYSEPAPESYAALGADYMPESNGRMSLKADAQGLQMIPVREKGFKGVVYIICDGLTTDAAAALAMMGKRTKRVRVVGEETGSNATSWCGGLALQVTLPRTGCILHLPLMRFVPEGDAVGAADRGELPDYPVFQQPESLADGVDQVRASLISLIGEMR